MKAADLGDPTIDPEALYWLIQIIRYSATDHALTSSESIDARWARLRQAGKIETQRSATPGTHSDYVVTADREGNIAAVCHSISTSIWGTTGLVVDGIPLPDAAAFQQSELAALSPGAHLPMPVNPAIALHGGRAVQASSSIGIGLHAATIQGLHATLRLGLGPAIAVARPLVHGENSVLGDSVTSTVTVEPPDDSGTQAVDDQFDPKLLDAVRRRGQAIQPYPVDDYRLPRGFWATISRSSSGELLGACTPFAQGSVRGV